MNPEVITADPALLTVKSTQEESHDAFDSWGFNCGPAAIAAVAGLTLNELHPQRETSRRSTTPTQLSCGAASTGLAFVGDCGPERPVELSGPVSALRKCSGKVHGRRQTCPYVPRSRRYA